MRLRPDTPPATELIALYNASLQLRVSQRFGQWVANNYLVEGTDGPSWPELYYEANPAKALALVVLEQQL